MQDASPATYQTPSAAADPLRLTERLSARTLLIGGVLTIVLVLLIGVEQDPDFWWPVRVGGWMGEHGRLPSQDLFTFTVSTHDWCDFVYLTVMMVWCMYCMHGLTDLSFVLCLLIW